MFLVRQLFEESASSRAQDIACHESRLEGIKAIKRLMKEQGVSMNELTGTEPRAPEKRAYQSRGGNVSAAQFLEALTKLAEAGIVNLSPAKIAKAINLCTSSVYRKLTDLKKQGVLVPLEGGGYQIINKD